MFAIRAILFTIFATSVCGQDLFLSPRTASLKAAPVGEPTVDQPRSSKAAFCPDTHPCHACGRCWVDADQKKAGACNDPCFTPPTPAPTTPQCFASQWSEAYDGVLTQTGFDNIVARCPDGESDFYDNGTSPLQGKYEWYCASRGNYLHGHRPSVSPSLTVSGYQLASSQHWMRQKQWTPGSFSRHVSFDGGFYPLSDGSCYVDFAADKIGGGVFRRGLAQEEKMFLQLPELLLVVRERNSKGLPLYLSSLEYPNNSTVLAFKDVVRPVAVVPKDIDMQCGWPPKSAQPCASFEDKQHAQPAMVTVIAVNALDFWGEGNYSGDEFDFLSHKVLGAFGAAFANGCNTLNSGRLGAGVFNGNLDLATILHAVMSIAFHVPVKMWGIPAQSKQIQQIVGWIEQEGLPIDTALRKLRAGVTWGHGRQGKSRVDVDRSRWERA